MKITVSKKGWLILGGIGVIGLGIGSYFLFFHNKDKDKSDKYGNLKLKGKSISGGIEGGIQTTKDRKGIALTEPNWDNPFDMNYANDVKAWVKPKIYVLNKSAASKYAKELKDAYGGWGNDDELAVKTVFAKKLKDKVQVANVSWAFWHNYKKDMWEYLANFLSSSEMEAYVHQPARALPNYRIVK